MNKKFKYKKIPVDQVKIDDLVDIKTYATLYGLTGDNVRIWIFKKGTMKGIKAINSKGKDTTLVKVLPHDKTLKQFEKCGLRITTIDHIAKSLHESGFPVERITKVQVRKQPKISIPEVKLKKTKKPKKNLDDIGTIDAGTILDLSEEFDVEPRLVYEIAKRIK